MDRETKYDRSIRQTSCMTEQDHEKTNQALRGTLVAGDASAVWHAHTQASKSPLASCRGSGDSEAGSSLWGQRTKGGLQPRFSRTGRKGVWFWFRRSSVKTSAGLLACARSDSELFPVTYCPWSFLAPGVMRDGCLRICSNSLLLFDGDDRSFLFLSQRCRAPRAGHYLPCVKMAWRSTRGVTT